MTRNEQFFNKTNRLQQLRGFCYAAQYGSISRAAEFMGLTQSGVSLQIKALEEDIGSALFYRNGPQITLTRDGEELLEIALPLVDNIQRLPEIFQRKKNQTGIRELRIAANGTAKNYLLPQIISLFMRSNEDASVVLHYAEHHEAMELLRENKVDLALLPRREHLPFPKTFEYLPIFFCRPSLITLPDHPLAGRSNLLPSEISRYPFTLPAEELRVIPNLYDIFEDNSSRHLRLSFMNTETGREYIEAGLAITISSDIWLRENDTLVATPLTHLFPNVDYGIVRKRTKTVAPMIQSFIAIAYQHALARNRGAAAA